MGAAGIPLNTPLGALAENKVGVLGTLEEEEEEEEMGVVDFSPRAAMEIAVGGATTGRRTPSSTLAGLRPSERAALGGLLLVLPTPLRAANLE